MCFTGVSGGQTRVKAGNSDSNLRKVLALLLGKREGLGEVPEESVPSTCKCVLVSMSFVLVHVNH